MLKSSLSLPGTSPVVQSQQPPCPQTPVPSEPPMDSSTPQPQNPPTTSSSTTLPQLFHPPLQNVEQFGSFLGEEIVANWRRSLERTIHSVMSSSPPADGAPQQPAKISTPVAADSTEKSAASTPQPADPPTGPSPQPSPLQLNGNPKSPTEDNNNLHASNNNNMNTLNAAMLSVNNFLRNEDSLKSPYRFDDHRSPFRFADELGMPGAMVGRLGESLIPKGDPMEARLQEMLRYNMDKYASQNLDTLHISRRVRELLSIHNIGQRLFAKYILGLSQGTVSELLSKPKPWDKLTEKGRDSYRKMHAWACDENAVMLLKSLIPKKGEFFKINTFFSTNLLAIFRL